jgi:hypothetical protein
MALPIEATEALNQSDIVKEILSAGISLGMYRSAGDDIDEYGASTLDVGDVVEFVDGTRVKKVENDASAIGVVTRAHDCPEGWVQIVRCGALVNGSRLNYNGATEATVNTALAARMIFIVESGTTTVV